MTIRGGRRARSTRVATASSSARAPAPLILEALEHAEARGATPLAELDRLRGDGRRGRTSRCRRRAGSARSGRPAGRSRRPASSRPTIDHLNAHATSTPEGDKAELQAIKTIFGEHAAKVAVTANKSMLGHTLGAAGAIEAIFTILAIRTGIVPPDDQPRIARPGRATGST